MNNTRIARVAVEFLADGHLGFIVLIDERVDGFTCSSLAAAKHIKFNPAWKGGETRNNRFDRRVLIYGLLKYTADQLRSLLMQLF